MKKVSDTQAKTPSGTTRTEEILDDINVLVGQISKAEDLCVSNLKTISSALDAKLLAAIVHNTEAMVEFSSTQSTALMGILPLSIYNFAKSVLSVFLRFFVLCSFPFPHRACISTHQTSFYL